MRLQSNLVVCNWCRSHAKQKTQSPSMHGHGHQSVPLPLQVPRRRVAPETSDRFGLRIQKARILGNLGGVGGDGQWGRVESVWVTPKTF